MGKFNYHSQRSWGKVIFSQASVILSMGGVPAPGGLLPEGCLVLGGACSQGVPAPRGLLPGGGVPGPRGGACWRPPGMATAAGGTHPTGMHSCFK